MGRWVGGRGVMRWGCVPYHDWTVAPGLGCSALGLTGLGRLPVSSGMLYGFIATVALGRAPPESLHFKPAPR